MEAAIAFAMVFVAGATLGALLGMRAAFNACERLMDKPRKQEGAPR